MIQMREVVRCGRKTNFYITENSFIDHYARDVGPVGIAVYHVLERHMNCETRSTWIGTSKIAHLLNVSQRTVQRTLKTLEDLRLIRILRTANLTTYVVMPVPQRTKTSTAPLFDAIPDEILRMSDIHVASDDSLVADDDIYVAEPTSVSRVTTPMSRMSDTDVAAYKEEQDFINKTQEQDFINKTPEKENTEIHEAAKRVIKNLSLRNTMINAAVAAVEIKTRGTKLSTEAVVQEIWTEAIRAERRGISRENFLADSLASTLAERILDDIHLPALNNSITTVMAALKAEAKDRDLGLEETASLITTAAIEDRRRGILIDRFYFENCKWRSNVRASKAEQRKLDNLEVNAKVKQRLRERLGTS